MNKKWLKIFRFSFFFAEIRVKGSSFFSPKVIRKMDIQVDLDSHNNLAEIIQRTVGP